METDQRNSSVPVQPYDLTVSLGDVHWREIPDDTTENTLFALSCTNGSKITVLDRMTGYGFGIRDIESGYRDTQGKFWLASGRCDVRTHPEFTIQQAIEWIQAHANTCVGA
jgi:hypothetical protein